MNKENIVQFPNSPISFDQYKELYQKSLDYPDHFWSSAALHFLSWEKPFTKAFYGDFEQGNISWFADGQINACYNALDRHAYKNPDKTALIYEADEPSDSRILTYGQLFIEVCQLANYISSLKYLKPGDVVTIYLPMIPEAVISMLACARLGLVHNVVFGGFSAEALKDRIADSRSSLVITANQGLRGGKIIPLKSTVDTARSLLDVVKQVLVVQRTKNEVSWNFNLDVWWHEVVPLQRPYCPYYVSSAESPLFMLYTSGSTGKPKGLLHTTGGYLLYTLLTIKYIFDLQENDKFGCMADIGWITGHSYVVYGPLCLGVTTTLFESLPTYPTPSRYWEMVDKYQLTQLYTAPTVIRALKALGDHHLDNFSLQSLRVIGSVGEPIHPETWKWYFTHVGRNHCNVVDTFWQTETGGIVITPLAGDMPTKPGSASFPFFGIHAKILDPQTHELSSSGILVITKPWPGMARTIYGDHRRYRQVYFSYPFYLTGDGAYQDQDGFYFLTGRVDDVLNVSGHRLSTAEIESALGTHPLVAEAAVLGEDDEITGQSICAFITLKALVDDQSSLYASLRTVVRNNIGPIATPKRMVICPDLPKTRSGKIMRRILRKLIHSEAESREQLVASLGDLTTLSDPSVIDKIIIAIELSEEMTKKLKHS